MSTSSDFVHVYDLVVAHQRACMPHIEDWRIHTNTQTWTHSDRIVYLENLISFGVEGMA